MTILLPLELLRDDTEMTTPFKQKGFFYLIDPLRMQPVNRAKKLEVDAL